MIGKVAHMQDIEGGVTAVGGFSAAGMSSGIKKDGRPDLALLISQTPAVAAAVFTQHQFQAPPLLLNKTHLGSGQGRAVIINSGNANAFTGKRGYQDALTMAQTTAKALGIQTRHVYVASTGIIGEFLPINRIQATIPALVSRLSENGGHAAAEAIGTTDTFVKEAAVVGKIGKSEIRVGGMAKGSGMVCPNMATMLAFLTTDVSIQPKLLQEGLRLVCSNTFNAITVDGAISTNDMVLCFANGRQGPEIVSKGAAYRQFIALLEAVSLKLAKMIVKDGEGATKFIAVQVMGASNVESARRVANAIANSNLVKTAFYGEDTNWGRIVAAAGGAGVPIDPKCLDISFGTVTLVEKGVYQGVAVEEAVSALLKKPEITLTLHLHAGSAQATVWMSDLSTEYIRINASYRS